MNYASLLLKNLDVSKISGRSSSREQYHGFIDYAATLDFSKGPQVLAIQPLADSWGWKHVKQGIWALNQEMKARDLRAVVKPDFTHVDKDGKEIKGVIVISKVK